MQAVRELLVFLGSPGDVHLERESVREVERRINANFEDQGVRVRIVGYEQVRPELGRPQELINPLVYKCDVFIGLLSKRWGSETGVYTSGFEEEFNVAVSRRGEGGAPAIGMFFAHLAPDAIADPGPQLRLVLGFQERVRAERIALYKEYRSTDHLATEVLDFLTGHALDLAGRSAGDGVDDSAAAPVGNTGSDTAAPSPQIRGRADAESAEESVQATDPRPGAEGPKTNDAAQQIAGALRRFADVFDSPEPSFGQDRDRDRVTLVGTAFAIDERLLGTHHVNRLYRGRGDLKITNGEAWTWMRTHFADRQDDRASRTVPMWALFHPTTENGKDLREDLVGMATNEDHDVSRGTITFMTEHQIRPPGMWPKRTEGYDQKTDQPGDGQNARLDESLKDGREGRTDEAGREEPKLLASAVSSWVQIYEQMPGAGVTANYMLTVATEDDLQLIDALAEGGELGDTSQAAVLAVAASLRGDPRPLALLAPSPYVEGVDELVDRIARTIPDLGESELRELLTSRRQTLLIPAALEMIGRGHFEKADLTTYLKANDSQIDAALVQRVVDIDDGALSAEIVGSLREDKDLDDGDMRAARVLATVCDREALDLLNANEPYKQIVWEAITIHDPVGMLVSAREVLDDHADFLSEKVAPFKGEYEVLAESMVDVSKRASCVLLAQLAGEHSSEERSGDLDRVIAEFRRDNFRSRRAALEAVIALVDESSVDRVPVELIDGYWISVYVERLLASPLATRLVRVWRESSVSDLRIAAEKWIIRQPERTDAELEEALYGDVAEVRITAIDSVLSRWSHEQVVALLDRYDQQNRRYWYNVIAAIDEHLYGFRAIVEPSEQATSTP